MGVITNDDPAIAALKQLTDGIAGYDATKDRDEVAYLMMFPVGVQPILTPTDNVSRLVLTWVETNAAEQALDPSLPKGLGSVLTVEKTTAVPRVDKITTGTTGVGTIITHVIAEIMALCEPITVERNTADPIYMVSDINRSLMQIGHDTRCGHGNFIIGNQAMIDEVKSYYPFASQSFIACVIAEQVEADTLILAYRGGSPTDAGIIVAPQELRSTQDSTQVKYDLLVPDTTPNYYKVLKFQ